ncbi:MAG: hypothetical protein J6328_07485 [Bacilli bacterium]|nr:hypothetical protein [Bacilli bacterium]
MRYKFGDRVIPLIKKGAANEGDVGVIDAVHEKEKNYTVGFYAAEDCLIDSLTFFEDELRPFEGAEEEAPYEIGERLRTLVEKYSFPEGIIGEVVAIYGQTKAVALKVLNDKGEAAILPYAYREVAKILDGAPHCHHHHH